MSRVFLQAASFFLLIGIWLSAHSAPTSALRFDRLRSVIQSDLTIVSLLQDQQGFIWIGTHNTGLYRYDGYRAVRYSHSPSDPRTLPHDQVSALFEDGNRQLWVGTQAGLARYDPVTNDFTLFVPPSGAPNHRLIKQIIADGSGGMWLATWGGLQHFDPTSTKFTQYTHDSGDGDSLNSNDVNAIAMDHRGGVWVSTWPGGIDYLPRGSRKLKHFRVDSADTPDPKINLVRALFFDQEHRLWIGTERGAYRWIDGTPWDSRIRLNAPQSRINSFYQDKAGSIWAGTAQAGLLKWEAGNDTAEVFIYRPDDPHSLQSNDIRAVVQDRGHVLWIGSFNAGISTVNLGSQGFSRLLPHTASLAPSSLANNSFLSIGGGTGNDIWVAGHWGMSLFSPQTGRVGPTYFSDTARSGDLAAKSVYSLLQEEDGTVWAGTSAGLFQFDARGQTHRVHHFGAGAEDFINAVVRGSGGYLWLGTGRSLVRFHPASGAHVVFTHQERSPQSLSLKGVTSVLEDRRGRVWIGSEWSSGLNLLDPATGAVRHFFYDGNSNGLSDDKISAIHEGKDGRVWLGTSSGLNEVITSPNGDISFRSYASRQSVGPVKVMSIQTDDRGVLWIATVAGLVAFDPDSGVIRRFRASDGITDGFNNRTSFAAPDGTLYFGGVQGITAINPSAVHSVAHAPQVSITDISVDGKSLSEAMRPAGVRLEGAVTSPRSLTLPPEATVFSIEFAALHFTAPSESRYRYRLNGFDPDWREVDASHRNATYTNLDPGTYGFEVRAKGADGIWGDVHPQIAIEILPPFWKTLWFRLLVLLLLAGLIVLVYQLRIRALKQTHVMLEQLVSDRTKELEESNAKLATLSQMDGLTNITNRRGFDAALVAEWAQSQRSGKPVALAMIDVDHFKRYNDHYGHQAGDQCLREVATAISMHARRASDLPARYGGEEFVLLMPQCNARDAHTIASALCRSISSKLLPHEESPFGVVTVSIGVFAMVGSPNRSPAQLVEGADKALYKAKEGGRNQAKTGTFERPIGGQEAPDSQLKAL